MCIVKVCSCCKEEKDLSCFYKQKDGKFGVTSRCKICVLLSNKKWAAQNKDTRLKLARKHRESNYQICLERTRIWRKNNLKYDAYRAKLYRSRKRNQLPDWADLNKIKEIYLNCPNGFHVDHIIPLKGLLASGLHIETNLQYLSAKENLRKRNLFGWE